MNLSVSAMLSCVLLSAVTCEASALHGRVKDERCRVLGELTVHIRQVNPEANVPERTLLADDGGSYNVELAPGTYDVCVGSSARAQTCTRVEMPLRGDKWLSTQIRDAAPDLSNVGNHTE